jgi:hypothetical protein
MLNHENHENYGKLKIENRWEIHPHPKKSHLQYNIVTVIEVSRQFIII